MNRALVLVAVCTCSSFVAADAFGQPAKKPTPNSSSSGALRSTGTARNGVTANRTGGQSAAAGTQPNSTSTQSANSATSGDYEVERQRIWNSAEMQAARLWIVDRTKLSKRTTTQQTQQFLTRLSQLPPKEMQAWLDRFQAQQARFALAMAVQDSARQMAVDHALHRLDATQQAYANISLGQDRAADSLRTTLLSQQEVAQQLLDVIRTNRGAAFESSLQLSYNPYSPVFDPASPNAYTRYAAAVSLPGDLARGDSLNFIRGDVNPDTGVATGIQGIGTATIGPPGLGGGGSATGNQGAVGPGGAGAAADAAGAGAGGGGGGGGP